VVSTLSILSDPASPGIGLLRATTDGRRLAIGSRRNLFPATYSVAIADFNRTTGAINNPYLARVINNAQGGLSYFEFSSDGSKLYTVEYPSTIVQLDFCAGSPAAVVASANTVVTLPAASTYTFYRGIQRALNGQIYLTQITNQGYSNTLAAIQQPNNAGSACSFSLNVQSIGGGTYAGWLPHFPSYLIKPLIGINQPDQTCSKVAFTSPSTVCASAGGSLSTFYWNFGEPASSTNTSTLFSPSHSYASAGAYTVKLIMGDGQCVADTLYKLISVLPNPTLNISVSPLTQSLCPGQNTTLTALGASTYTWLPGLLSGSQVTVAPQSTTTYTVKGEDNAGCANSRSVSVYVYPINTITVTTIPKSICAGQAVTLTANGALSYTWNTGSLSPSLTVPSASTTVYAINATGAFSCTTVTNFTLNALKCTGIAGLNEDKILYTIYPNPTKETLTIKCPLPNTVIALFSSQGTSVYEKINASSEAEEIDLQNWPKGIYFVKLTSGKHSIVNKVLVE